MKTTLAVVAALLVGLALGSWSVKSDLRIAREEIAELKRAASQRATRQTTLRSVTSALNLPDAPATTRRPQPPLPPAAAAVESTATNAPARHPPRRSIEAELQTATDLWKTRSALARESFFSNIAASPVQQQMFDLAVQKLNDQLAERIRQWTDYITQQREMTAETGVRMMNNLSEPVIAAYDELDRALSPGWREQAGPKFQVFDFINPEVALPLAEVEGTIQHSEFPERRRGPAR